MYVCAYMFDAKKLVWQSSGMMFAPLVRDQGSTPYRGTEFFQIVSFIRPTVTFAFVLDIKNGLEPILYACVFITIDAILNIGPDFNTDPNADVICEQGINSSV